jgi:hypothetical protein
LKLMSFLRARENSGVKAQSTTGKTIFECASLRFLSLAASSDSFEE